MSRPTATGSICGPTAQRATCAGYMKVLADDTRLAVIQQLLKRPLHVHEINAELHIDPTLLSHHLRVLREAGLVRVEREGRSLLYRLSSEIRMRQRRRVLDFGCCQLSFTAPARLPEAGEKGRRL